MIAAKLEELYEQIPSSAGIRQGLDFIAANRASNLADGRYEIDGTRVYALVQSYQTLPAGDESKYEAHRQYLDIQFIVEGSEGMGWTKLENMKVTQEYNPAKDVILGTCPLAQATLIRVDAGQAALFFPSDAHAPKLAVAAPGPVRKIVVKVQLE
jgi:YhcH/YjgK/YiaL family protein